MGQSLTGCDRISDPAGGVIHTAVDNPLLILARRRDGWLLPLASPHPAEGRMTVDFNFVLVDQDLWGIGLKPPF